MMTNTRYLRMCVEEKSTVESIKADKMKAKNAVCLFNSDTLHTNHFVL